MEPITLRLPTDLLDTLDEEAEDVGFSSRSEYIRHLLQNRDRTVPATQIGTDQNTTDVDDSERFEGLSEQISEMEDRLTSLEGDVDELRSAPIDGHSSDEPSGRGEPPEREGNPTETGSSRLEQWLEEQGPQSEDARTIMIEAARILEDEGPVSARDLREQLYEQYPDAYDSADALWSSTVERLYNETPGFQKPEYGKYGFDRERLDE